MVSNPNVTQIYNNYLHSLSTLLPYQERHITSLEDEIQFTEVMADLVQTHSNTIPVLARGFLECRKYISPAIVTRFLDEHLRARIGTRLIAEQHIALHLSSQPHRDPKKYHAHNEHPSYIGVIDTSLCPAEVIWDCEHFVAEICELNYGVRPSLEINGQAGLKITHVPAHLEYILTELLKNAFRATVESGKEHEPIEITIAASPQSAIGHNLESPQLVELDDVRGPGLGDRSVSEVIPTVPGVTIRIRDRGGGISPENFQNIWNYSFTTFREDESPNGNIDALNAISGAGGEGSSLAGLGYGLPLSRAYAEYFGGGIALQSLWGWGTDVYLNLKGLGKIS